MRFERPLLLGALQRRRKRFLADVRLDTGEEVTAHCANPGAMLGLLAPGARAALSRADDPARKLAYSWELVEADFGRGPEWAGVSTAAPNLIVGEAIRAGFFEDSRHGRACAAKSNMARRAASISCSKATARRPSMWR
jgi:sugar fermentation stimulation protein A